MLEFTLEKVSLAIDFILEQNKKCIAFYAPMGAGKTTLINALCSRLNVIDATSSPTFSIINEYAMDNGGKAVHMDWYRLKGEEDAINTGVQDYLLSGDYCFIEWPEIAEGLLPNDCLKLKIEMVNMDTRILSCL